MINGGQFERYIDIWFLLLQRWIDLKMAMKIKNYYVVDKTKRKRTLNLGKFHKYFV